jgi:arylsulfate sulfotransferase
LGLDWQRFSLLHYSLILTVILSGCAGGASQSSGPHFEQLAGFNITPSAAVLETGQSVVFATTGSSGALVDLTWKVNGVAGGSAATGTISASGIYMAPTSAPAGTITVTATNAVSNVTTNPAQVSFFNPKTFAGGTVSSSNNPLVARYSAVTPLNATVQVQFGTTANYGLATWVQPAPPGGGVTEVLVAGMHANTTYHMQATLQLATGEHIVDADRVFTTGDVPAASLPSIAVPQTAGANASPGVELLDIYNPSNTTGMQAIATDLAGNLIWYYPLTPGEVPFPIKLLPNGHMLIVVAGANAGEIREIDLAGNVIFRLGIGDIDAGLTKIGTPFMVENIHHDILKLANGHFIILVNYTQTYTDMPGVSSVVGDALIDWDPQAQMPVWTWSSFDHIPLSHAPNGTADWTHANAVIYSPDDGDLILSMRNQNWVIKINYKDGAGDGGILWHLGPDGDFALPNGQAPLEWNYGQHYPTILTSNSAGIFQMMFFNNGNNRLVDSNNDVCVTSAVPGCYSSVPIFELNESAKTAQVLWETNLASHYSVCCGNAEELSNGNVEYDVAFDVNTPNQSFIQEVTQEQPPNSYGK